jgi:concanavalin A-like lectin/glucanase superfamily protein
MFSGTGYQTGATRWGDYSMTTIDPSDGMTFWHVNEYQAVNGSSNWHTRIGKFNFEGSGASPTPTPTSSPSPTATATASPSCAPPPPDMVSWWPGDGNTDDIIDGNNGTLQTCVPFAAGEVGQAFSFDGSNYVDVPDAANLNFDPTSPLSVDMWVYRTGTENVMHFLGKRSGCSGDSGNYQIGFDNQAQLGLFWGEVHSHIDLPLNVWTHIAGTFDGITFRLYMNGGLIGSASGMGGPTNTAPLRIGTSGDCSGVVGLIDEVDIYNRALSQAEIQAIYNAGSAGKCK